MRNYVTRKAAAHSVGGMTQAEGTALMTDADLKRRSKSNGGKRSLLYILDALNDEAGSCDEMSDLDEVTVQINRIRLVLDLPVARDPREV